MSFLTELGQKLTDASGDTRETIYLFQQVSGGPVLQYLVAFNDTFTVPTEMVKQQCTTLASAFDR